MYLVVLLNPTERRPTAIYNNVSKKKEIPESIGDLLALFFPCFHSSTNTHKKLDDFHFPRKKKHSRSDSRLKYTTDFNLAVRVTTVRVIMMLMVIVAVTVAVAVVVVVVLKRIRTRVKVASLRRRVGTRRRRKR
jgi:hypothetical protein